MNSYEIVAKWYESSDAKPEVLSSKPNTSSKKKFDGFSVEIKK